MEKEEKIKSTPPISKDKKDKPERRSDRQVWLSVSESAKLGGLETKTIRRAIKSKKLKYKVSGNRYAIRLSSIIEFSHSNPKLRNKFYSHGLGQYVDSFKKGINTKADTKTE